MNPDICLAFIFGFAAGLFIHALLWLRLERIHGADLRREYEDGKNLGYNQCHGEMVVPMQQYIERVTGRKLDWTPLKKPGAQIVQPKQSVRVLIIVPAPKPPQLMSAAH